MMKELVNPYNYKKDKNFEDIVDFHAQFEKIHPFQDGNGRVGTLIAFKECLIDTYLEAQDTFKELLNSLKIEY